MKIKTQPTTKKKRKLKITTQKFDPKKVIIIIIILAIRRHLKLLERFTKRKSTTNTISYIK